MSETQDRTEQANRIVGNYRLYALGVGLIPFPWVDMAALAALQLKMLYDLSSLYEIPFSENIGKSSVAALVSGGGLYPVSSLAKLLPFAGWLVSATSASLFSAASTYAVGRVFIQHFESGGTFLSFDPEKVRDYYQQQLAAGTDGAQESFAGQQP